MRSTEEQAAGKGMWSMLGMLEVTCHGGGDDDDDDDGMIMMMMMMMMQQLGHCMTISVLRDCLSIDGSMGL
jgi:hypothetical protein